MLAVNYSKGFAECQDILVDEISDKTKMFMLLFIVTHFKMKKGALFFYVYNFQIVKRLSISVGDPQIESPM